MGLTDLHIRKLAPKKRRYEVSDGKGLSIRVMPSGAKSWIFRYQFDGTARRMTLGAYPGITLADARQKHGAAMADVQRGIDPGEQLIAAKAKRKAAPTFQDMLHEIWEVELQHKKSGMQTRKLLEKDAIPAWSRRKMADIKRRDIVLLLDKIRERAPIVANRVHGALSRLFNFAAERGVIDDSPCTRIRKTPEKGRSRVLADDEIKKLWAALDLENKDVDIYRVTKLALKLLLLTGQRPGEVAGMAWSEIEGDFWNIPGNRMKNDQANRVPLCAMALEVIEQARAYSADGDFVFRSSHKPDKAMTRHALTRAIARHWSEMGIEKRFTPHDLRRTLRTKLAELGVSDIVAERVLGHKLQGMMAVYNRHAYDLEKRQALERWERRLQEILGFSEPPQNVIQFNGRRV
jgi:integrase